MIITKITKVIEKILHLPLIARISILSIFTFSCWFGYQKLFTTQIAKVSYQTETVTKGTVISSVTGSGTVSTANSASVNTKASGVVKAVYVKDGDMVSSGDKIAEVDLDMSGQQNASSALASYQSAKNNVESARIAFYTTQSDMLTNWKDHYELATSSTYQNADGTPNTGNRALAEYYVSDNTWLASEAKYKNQQNVLAQAQSSLNSAWLSYQEASGIIYAPITGTVSGLSLQVGSVISTTTSSTATVSSTKVASIKTDAPPTVTVNLTEIDVPKIKIGNKATVTFDALADKTFTGKVISVDTSGSVSSGVTTYPAVILLDVQSSEILPNMAASANIITAIKNNVINVTSTAVQKQSDGSYLVQVMENGTPQNVTVEIGLSSDTKIEITSGLSGGETVVTSTITTGSTTPRSGTTSVFGSFGGGGGVRMR